MTRYVIYALPGADHPGPTPARRLREVVTDWFARDDMREVTIDARRYGYHATVKAPFHLADGVTEADLHTLTSAVVARHHPVTIPSLKPAVISGFRVLTPTGNQEDINHLAAEVVRRIDTFRAPLTPDEYTRRRPDQLTPGQRELLDEYGYPYVLDEYRFHITLTDTLPPRRETEIDQQIAAHFSPVIGVDVLLTALAICVEPTPGGPFELLSLHPLNNQETTR
ncbi:DUF1045 domain-containing protein [Nocardia sp. NPDC059239]|uniref:DUF1045 domain-containing protein n=1 Tax=Nocardia sp. NPDC059239 TaxID=3346785 RepID=UPI0036CA48E4